MYIDGSNLSWKEWYCVLTDDSFSFYVKAEDKSPKEVINLKTGRGVRTKEQCKFIEEWPKEAEEDVTFGVSEEKETHFFYGTEKEEVE